MSQLRAARPLSPGTRAVRVPHKTHRLPSARFRRAALRVRQLLSGARGGGSRACRRLGGHGCPARGAPTSPPVCDTGTRPAVHQLGAWRPQRPAGRSTRGPVRLDGDVSMRGVKGPPAPLHFRASSERSVGLPRGRCLLRRHTDARAL